MPVSHRGRFIFIHVPKCGGTSIEYALQRRYGELAYMKEFGPPTEPLPEHCVGAIVHGSEQHFSALELRDILGPAVYDSYFSFAIVRHPVARLLSFYTFATGKEASWKIQSVIANQSQSFDEFVRRLAETPHMKPFFDQACYLADTNGRMLVNHIGRFERLEEEFRMVGDAIAAQSVLASLRQRLSPLRLPRLNASGPHRGGPGRPTIDKDTLAFLAPLVERDCRVFGYTPDHY